MTKEYFDQCMNGIKSGQKTEVSEELYYQFLEVVPPLKMFSNGFIMGECYSGRTYFKFTKEGSKYYGELTTI